MKIISRNKKASYNYTILDTFEAGIILQGSEVKSCRFNGCNIANSYCIIRNNKAWLIGCNIAPYTEAYKTFQHDTMRDKELLFHKKEILRFNINIKEKGYTLVPIEIYFNNKNKIKVKIGLCKGKNAIDKRESIKKKDIEREMRRNIDG